jgi:hypothetical protein
MKFNQVLGTGKLFGFQNYDVVPDVVMGKVELACQWVLLYRINRNDGFIE